jgi:hypothetical protein
MSILYDHIEGKLNEAKFFLAAMEMAHAAHKKHVLALRKPFEAEGAELAHTFQYNFSAFLSAHRAVRYYIIRVSRRIADTARWRKDIDNNPVLEALHHLRDVDIHDETLNMKSTTRLLDLQTNPKIEVSGLILDEKWLGGLARLGKHPAALEYLIGKNILNIAHEGIAEVERAVAEGRERGYLRPQRAAGY